MRLTTAGRGATSSRSRALRNARSASARASPSAAPAVRAGPSRRFRRLPSLVRQRPYQLPCLMYSYPSRSSASPLRALACWSLPRPPRISPRGPGGAHPANLAPRGQGGHGGRGIGRLIGLRVTVEMAAEDPEIFRRYAARSGSRGDRGWRARTRALWAGVGGFVGGRRRSAHLDAYRGMPSRWPLPRQKARI